ncbi:MAG: HDOD domain-containing protein [Nitrospina sp.]|jgi:HD-like signal output (HDOD) protein|nr:HDOD domain-containing protein [Nitrospina sp.]MBT6716351.1 HDOD domain-containing protein [Nitrospina sp.]
MKKSLHWFRSIKNLPSLPEQINSVLVATGSTSSMDYNIVEIIQYDPSMALSVLKVANSPVYGYSKKISSLQQAAGLLGPGAIKNIILRTPILERYLTDQKNVPPIDFSALWLHCGITASLSGGLGRLIGNLESDVCFTAGLIHDAGAIALSAFYPQELAEAFEISKKEKISLLDAEKKVFGFNSSEVNNELMTAWNFPDSLLDSYSDSLESMPPQVSKQMTVVALAKLLASEWDYPSCTHPHNEPSKEILLKSLKITANDLSEWEPELKKYALLAVSFLKREG